MKRTHIKHILYISIVSLAYFADDSATHKRKQRTPASEAASEYSKGKCYLHFLSDHWLYALKHDMFISTVSISKTSETYEICSIELLDLRAHVDGCINYVYNKPMCMVTGSRLSGFEHPMYDPDNPDNKSHKIIRCAKAQMVSKNMIYSLERLNDDKLCHVESDKILRCELLKCK